jgi:hypothetical protein
MEDKETTRKQDEQLGWDIGFAIWQSRALPTKDRSIERCRSVGTAVVKHLRLCAWTFDKARPQTPHSAGQTVPQIEGDVDV